MPFYRNPSTEEGYVLPRQELLEKVDETVALGGDQILLQGGLHPNFKLDWYEELLLDIKTPHSAGQHPRFQPAGDLIISPKSTTYRSAAVLARLQAAGLGSIPGRRRRDPRRSRAANHAGQSHDGRLA